MKKLLFRIAVAGMVLSICAMSANAQPGGQRQWQGQGQGQGQRMDPEQMAKMRAERMKTSLNLTDDQYNKLVELYKTEGTAFRPANGQMPSREDMQKMRDERNAKVKAILTDEQYQKWQESMQRGRGGQGQGQGGPRGQGGFGNRAQRFDPEAIAKQRADDIKEVCDLDDAQYAKVMDMYRKSFTAGPGRMDRAAMEKAAADQKAQLKEILTKKQFKTWTRVESERRAVNQGGFGGGQGRPEGFGGQGGPGGFGGGNQGGFGGGNEGGF